MINWDIKAAMRIAHNRGNRDVDNGRVQYSHKSGDKNNNKRQPRLSHIVLRPIRLNHFVYCLRGNPFFLFFDDLVDKRVDQQFESRFKLLRRI